MFLGSQAPVGDNGTVNLNDKRVVILGGTSGIGLAVARLALDQGASIVVASNRHEAVGRARADLSRKAPSQTRVEQLDVTNEEAVKRFFTTVEPFDHLIYTSGEDLPLGPLASTNLALARGRFEVRYWGAVAAVKYGVGSIRQGGSIVLTSGFSATRPRPGWTSQASIQSAIEGLTRALALELAPIRVNCVSPGLSATPRWNAMTPAVREALFAREENRVPLGRVGTADDIAAAYIYLMDNDFATGNVISVDGGGALV